MPGDVLMAAVIGAHGITGEVRLKSFARSADSLRAYGPLHDKTGRLFTIAAARQNRDEIVVRFSEVKDRNGAEALKGVKLFVARALLPATIADEYYHTDLIGLEAVDAEGRGIGKVVTVHNFGAGDVLEIADEGGADILIAFTRDNVLTVDIKNDRIVVAVPSEIKAGKDGKPKDVGP
jgi:16S rRNA processing protein RimM